MHKSSFSTFGFVLFSVVVPIVAGAIGGFVAFIKDRNKGRKDIAVAAAEIVAVTLGAIFLVSFFAYLIFFIPTVYDLHEAQAQHIASLADERDRLSLDIEDRKRNIRITEPAYEHIKIIYAMYAEFRRDIGPSRHCEIKITAPGDQSAANPILRQIVDPAGMASNCAAIGPMIAAMDPTIEPETTNGMEKGVLIIHTRKDQAGSLNIYDALAPYLHVKRSFSMPKNSPDVLIWFQFGNDLRWIR